HAGHQFRGFHGSPICCGLPGCLAPCTDLTGCPASGAFYVQAFNEIGPLLDMTTAVAGPLRWWDSHPLERQLDSLHDLEMMPSRTAVRAFAALAPRYNSCRRDADRPHRRATRLVHKPVGCHGAGPRTSPACRLTPRFLTRSARQPLVAKL